MVLHRAIKDDYYYYLKTILFAQNTFIELHFYNIYMPNQIIAFNCHIARIYVNYILSINPEISYKENDLIGYHRQLKG